ncbi:hypothetical protein FZ103_03495 [Streptomonospora sp. PA3]|uniref:hypothetical protein n=1 Tax=Streptomonospora sp. PA3 TaxID=2607326 RepID=UPI0012DE2DE4|nr:hypothetical protein [Streptomonospora sp. PA3]MUL40251.1 hypothetical protein [Streptomonospora sp. PA3]
MDAKDIIAEQLRQAGEQAGAFTEPPVTKSYGAMSEAERKAQREQAEQALEAERRERQRRNAEWLAEHNAAQARRFIPVSDEDAQSMTTEEKLWAQAQSKLLGGDYRPPKPAKTWSEMNTDEKIEYRLKQRFGTKE